MCFFRIHHNGNFFFFFSSRRRHTRFDCDWSSDVCSSDLVWSPACRVLSSHRRVTHPRAQQNTSSIHMLTSVGVLWRIRMGRPWPDRDGGALSDCGGGGRERGGVGKGGGLGGGPFYKKKKR